MKSKIFLSIVAALLICMGIEAQSIQRAVQPAAGGTLAGGSNQLSFTIGETMIPTLAAGSNMITQGFQQPGEQLLTGAITGTSFCAGSTVGIPFNAVDIGGGNSFTAQLSDASGSFASPVNIGTVSGNASGTIMATIPQNTAAGTAYRIRIVSSFPALTATDNSGSPAGLVVALSPNLWIGGNGNWSTPGNWCANVVPVSNANVLINAGNPQLDVDYSVAGTLRLEGSAAFTVLPLKTLDISPGGNASFGGRPVTFKSDITGYASLGQVRGTLSGATNVTAERYIPNNGFRSWRLLSVPTFGSQTIKQAWQENNAPLANATPNYGTQITDAGSNQATSQANGFDAAASASSMLRWNGTGWTGAVNTNATAISSQKAWFLFVRGERSKGITGQTIDASATTLRTNGSVYTGTQTTTVPSNSFTLVGNTYLSAINFTQLTRNNVNNLFYIWDSKKLNGNSLGAYQTFSGTNGYLCMLAGGSYALGQPNTTIESGQGFFVVGGPLAGGGTITLNESAKISGTSGNLGFRPAPLVKIDSRLYNSDGEMRDANTVVFNVAYSREIDKDDAPKMGNPAENFAVARNSRLLAIEGTQPLSNNDSIVFHMWNMKQQQYRLELVTANLAEEGMEAQLEDNYLKTNTPVNLNGNTSVNFAVNADAASKAANRFRIVFRKIPTAVEVKQGYAIAPNPVTNALMNVQFHAQPAGRYNLQVYTADGKAVYSRFISHPGGSMNHTLALPNKLAAGIYSLSVTETKSGRSAVLSLMAE